MLTVQLIPTIKVQISGRMSLMVCDVVTASSILGENPSEEVDIDNE